MSVRRARLHEPTSIRKALLLWLLLPLIALVPLAAALMYWLSVRPALDSLDRALTSTAAALNNMLDQRNGEVVLPISEQTAKALQTDPFDNVYFAATDPHGRLLAGDTELARKHPPPDAGQWLAGQPSVLAPGQWRFFDTKLHGAEVRVAALGTACGAASAAGVCRILVAESDGKRTEAQSAVLASAALTLLLLVIPLVGLSAIAVARGLRPLRRLGSDIERRSLENLQPIEAVGVPQEVAPVVTALNGLLARLRVASLAQQAFIADAAHQLRTPLTALRTESELAVLEGHPTELDATLRRIHASAARAARLANQLLSLASADNAAQTKPATVVDLRQVCSEAGENWVPQALEAGVDLGFALQPAWVTGRGHLLRELLGNLLHNAIEYAGRGANVTVSTQTLGTRVLLEVEDDGPGLPEAERERVWGRFQRGANAAGSGSGLGLAIVRDIAIQHGAVASLQTGAEGRGLKVSISFEAAVPTDASRLPAPN
jgi:two-component system sensor histidine kinase TctE